MTIRLRLTIYWAAIIAAILLIAGISAFLLFERQQWSAIDGALMEEADTSAASLSRLGPGEAADALVQRLSEERDLGPRRRVRIVSQVVWPGRTTAELPACMQHEALLNGAFMGRQLTALCLYDAGRLDDDVLAGARATHPLVWKCGALQRSAEYAPDTILANCNQPLPANPGAVTYMVRKSTDLRPARSFAVNYGDWVGLSQDGIDDLQLIATELATNSLMYTDGACRLAFWRHDEHLVCEARDSGRWDDPLVGRLDPGPTGPASRGLFLVNAISDLVRIHTTTSGTTIQAYPRLTALPGPTS